MVNVLKVKVICNLLLVLLYLRPMVLGEKVLMADVIPIMVALLEDQPVILIMVVVQEVNSAILNMVALDVTLIMVVVVLVVVVLVVVPVVVGHQKRMTQDLLRMQFNMYWTFMNSFLEGILIQPKRAKLNFELMYSFQ